MKIGSATPAWIATTVGLTALTIGLVAGVSVVYVFPPVVALLSAVGIYSAWKNSLLPETGKGGKATPPGLLVSGSRSATWWPPPLQCSPLGSYFTN